MIANVTNASAVSHPLALPGEATLTFRMRAVNSFGPSLPSLPTSRLCKTMAGGMYVVCFSEYIGQVFFLLTLNWRHGELVESYDL